MSRVLLTQPMWSRPCGRLWGDRARWGRIPIEGDRDWLYWQKVYWDFYRYQTSGIGRVVNGWGYSLAREIDWTGKRVLEIGPGAGKPWMGATRPAQCVDADRDPRNVSRGGLVISNGTIPTGADSFDAIVAFHVLEHIADLRSVLAEIARVLIPGGLLVGSVPCEGGLAWGLGRQFTGRRWALKHGINYDKIICWEHPNTVWDVADAIGSVFDIVRSRRRPFGFLPLGLNLSWAFVCRNNPSWA